MESIPCKRQSPPLLPLTLSPQKSLYSCLQQHASSPLATQMLLIFTATLSLSLFVRLLPEQDGSLGLGKKRPDSCQQPSVVEKQWHALCDSHCSSNLRRPPCCNPVSFIRQITVASSDWLCQLWPRNTETTWPTWSSPLPRGQKRKKGGMREML